MWGATAVQTFARPGLPALRPGVVEADGNAWGAGPVGGHLVAQPALPEEDRSRGGGQVDEGAVGLDLASRIGVRAPVERSRRVGNGVRILVAQEIAAGR